MRIEYICHSCLFIDSGDTSLLFDPWFKGTAYYGQWQLFPKPVDLSMMDRVKHIVYSHGHEDHLHEASLLELPKTAKVFYPYQWRRGAKEYFSSLGYAQLTEAMSFKKYRLSETTSITYIGFALESVIVVEIGKTVIVNINDALNSHHQNVVDIFLEQIEKRWPKIDYLFSGWSGAGYFPNMVHYPGKNDFEVGQLREQYFANNFCKIVHRLKPQRAIPFAPGFALLRPDRKWINEVKFPRDEVKSYYAGHFSADDQIDFFTVHPGDFFDTEKFHPVSPWRDRYAHKSTAALVEEEYPAESEAAKTVPLCAPEDLDALQPLLDKWVNLNRSLFDPLVLREARFSVELEDAPEPTFINIRFGQDRFLIHLENKIDPEHKLLLRTRAVLLRHALSQEWGGDVLTIGYGIDVKVYEEKTLEQNLDIVCVRLLTRYPTTRGSLKKDPFRAMAYFFRHPLMARLAIKQKLQLRNTINKFPYNERDHWISWSKCDLCKVCNMPELSFEFGESLVG